ncbi:hypothetical protein RintRC_7037 [Richelia intracellularis]|nr:hypothetical protein RintRC_7037 [Richelia intracellularis]
MTRLFGTVIANIIGYGGRKINRLFPLDGEFNLPAQQYSHGLRQRAFLIHPALMQRQTGILSI